MQAFRAGGFCTAMYVKQKPKQTKGAETKQEQEE